MARKEFTQRRRALDVIFEAEQKDILVPGLLRELLAERQQVSTSQVPIQELGVSLVNLVANHLYEIDGLIEDYSKWGLRRLSTLDRTILRLGIAEIVFDGANVRDAVNDYTAIVRELGSEKSIGFITAILNRAKQEADQPAERATGTAADARPISESSDVDVTPGGVEPEASAETLMAEADVDRDAVGDEVEAEADVIEADRAEVADALEAAGPLDDADEYGRFE
ncbi:hypothetical protein EJO69_02320 [Flaviflexus salsibiostraticola]|uniref:NusB/RsmB/TIM44 domain-containing protein n=1 Tax=Flaviflexus salsibiostraticola TaxID=1282737 RepID=A0A3Q8WSI4_9ACTO|nr:transcription antitermination factor NusB [Flaviflexus salsibiostraticola]AZN29263.1 hypothetical protein EJO69_02320 [Flaviflexus salsibiostraticola]